MHYFGGDGRTPEGVITCGRLMSPEWLIKNPVSPGTMMGPGMGYQNAEMWQAAVNGMNTMMGSQSYMSSYHAQALETVTTPAGTFVNALHVREQRGSAYVRDVWYAPGVGMVRWMDGQEEALLTKVTLPTGPVPPVMRAVEYYHAALDHYFTTADAAEIAALDAGQFQGWLRTGMAFNVVDPAADTGAWHLRCAATMAVPPMAWTRTSTRRRPPNARQSMRNWPEQWLLESANVFQVYMPDLSSGACPAGTLAVYRTWNHRTDTNHRYTMDRSVQNMMMGKGNIAEGYGNPPVAMCSPH